LHENGLTKGSRHSLNLGLVQRKGLLRHHRLLVHLGLREANCLVLGEAAWLLAVHALLLLLWEPNLTKLTGVA